MPKHASRRQRKQAAEAAAKAELIVYMECQRAIEDLYISQCAIKIQRLFRKTWNREAGFVVV